MMSFKCVIILLIIILGLIKYWSKLIRPWFRSAYLCFRLPGPRAKLILGNCNLGADPNAINTIGLTGLRDYGSIFRIWVSVIPSVLLINPEHVQLVLASTRHTEKSLFYGLLHNFLGEGLVTNAGLKWKLHRKLIQPLFTNSILENYLDTFVESSANLVKSLERSLQLDSSINITSLINECVMHSLNESILGIPLTDKNTPFRKGKVDAPYRLQRPWLLLNSLYQLTNAAKSELQHRQNLNNFTRKIINQVTMTSRQSLLRLVQDIPDFSEDDIVQEISTFMLAGQDTVGSAIAFTLYNLAKYPEAQDRVISELNGIFGSLEETPGIQEIDRMEYLEKCIKETLRLYPSVPLISRQAGCDIRINESITIPGGCTVFICPFMTHRIPEIFPNPDDFDPERFDPTENRKRHPYAFIPFSAGPRNCIGYKWAYIEMKTIISTILRNFRVELVPGKENIVLSWRVTVRAKGGIWLRFTPRSDKK